MRNKVFFVGVSSLRGFDKGSEKVQSRLEKDSKCVRLCYGNVTAMLRQCYGNVMEQSRGDFGIGSEKSRRGIGEDLGWAWSALRFVRERIIRRRRYAKFGTFESCAEGEGRCL